MNFTESFSDFSSRVSPRDLALYAGVGLVLWVLFKERMSPVQTLIQSLINKTKSLLNLSGTNKTMVSAPTTKTVSEDVFFKLVASWKQTRDLAVLSGCVEAVKVADQMFPFLSPNVCASKKEDKIV